jgi:hypothetical protein
VNRPSARADVNRRDPERGDTEERGAALLLAVAALTLVSLLGAVLLTNARAEIRRADRLVNRAETDSIIDVAVSTAWGDIVAGAATAFGGSGDAAGGPWSFRATPVTSTRWEITVDAGAGPDSVTGRVTITREALLPYSLLVDDVSTGPLSGRVEGRIAITGDARFAGRSLGDIQELIGEDATCTGCDNPVLIDATRDDDRVSAPDDRPIRSCPDVDGTITGLLEGNVVYECDDDTSLVFTGVVSVNGPVVFALGPEVTLRFDRADLNPAGDPADLLIIQPEADDPDITIVDTTLSGVLSVPHGRIAASGLRWEGMVAAAELVASSGSELTGGWTPTLESFGFEGWRITGWRTERN